MSKVYYVQECPTCGRRLEIRVEYLGRTLRCEHCHGEFVGSESRLPNPPQDDLLSRAERLLSLSSSHRAPFNPSVLS